MAKAKSRLHELAARGQSVWFDTLSRDLVHSGELKRMMDEDAVTGVTSNPTIFQKALSQGDAYDEDLKKLLAETDDPTKIFFSLALQDIRDACDVLQPAYDASGGIDGYVSMEVEPGIAYDTEKTFEQARWIATEVDRPNLYVKIPATEPGLPGDRGLHRARHVDQHHADLLARPLQGGRRGLPPRARAARRRRRRPVEGRVGRVVLRLAGRHRGRQAPRGRGPPEAEGQARDREREARLPALPRGVLGPALGVPRRARARTSSAACGRRRRRRTPTTAT